MQITTSNWMPLQIFLRKRGYPSATGSKGCGTRLKATGIAFWEMLYSISSELITSGLNLHSSWEKADAEQCWIPTCKLKASTSTAKPPLKPGTVLVLLQSGSGKAVCYLLQSAFTGFPPEGWDWAALRKSFGSAEANFHSCSYCYLSCTNKRLLTKITVTPNLSSTGTWKGNVFCQPLGYLGSVSCWISQDQMNFTAFFQNIPEIQSNTVRNKATAWKKIVTKSSKIFSNLSSKDILLNLKEIQDSRALFIKCQ